MLTPQDDLLGHQTPQSFAVAGGGNPLFTERYWYTAHPIDGTPIIIDMGLGYYPNRGVMDVFAGITVGRRQINWRGSRRLAGAPLRSRVGPFGVQVIEPAQRHRITLNDNDSGFSCDLTFEARFPVAREKQSVRERKGVVEEDLARTAQFGRYSGWFVVDGQRHEVKPDAWWGQRDHSWGIRSEMRTDEARPPVQTHTNFFWTWSMFQFEDFGVTLFAKERVSDKPYYLSGCEFRRAADGSFRERELTKLSHDIRWLDDPLGQTIESADLHLEFASGAPRKLHVQGLPGRFYLKGGLYGGFGGWNHGDDRGELYMEHDTWDLENARTRQLARTLSDHVLRATSDGLTGIGISEYGVASGYARYQIAQKHPAL